MKGFLKYLLSFVTFISLASCEKKEPVIYSADFSYSYTVTPVDGVIQDGQTTIENQPCFIFEITSGETVDYTLRYKIDNGNWITMSKLWVGVPRTVPVSMSGYGKKTVEGYISRADGNGIVENFTVTIYVRGANIDELFYEFTRTPAEGEAAVIDYTEGTVNLCLWDSPSLKVTSRPLSARYNFEVSSSNPDVVEVKNYSEVSKNGIANALFKTVSEGEAVLTVKTINGSSEVVKEIPVTVTFDPSVIDYRVKLNDAFFSSSSTMNEWPAFTSGNVYVKFDNVNLDSPHKLTMSIDGVVVYEKDEVYFSQSGDGILYNISLDWVVTAQKMQLDGLSLDEGEHTFKVSVERCDGLYSDEIERSFNVIRNRSIELVSLTLGEYWINDNLTATLTASFQQTFSYEELIVDFYVDDVRFSSNYKSCGAHEETKTYNFSFAPSLVVGSNTLKDFLTEGNHTIKVVARLADKSTSITKTLAVHGSSVTVTDVSPKNIALTKNDSQVITVFASCKLASGNYTLECYFRNNKIAEKTVKATSNSTTRNISFQGVITRMMFPPTAGTYNCAVKCVLTHSSGVSVTSNVYTVKVQVHPVSDGGDIIK